ncbi:lasso RiPP family leader peptide-containing protein [Streptomyces sp. NPDC002536]
MENIEVYEPPVLLEIGGFAELTCGSYGSGMADLYTYYYVPGVAQG